MRKGLAVTLVIVAGIGVWLFFVSRWHDALRPAGPSLADHLAHRPQPDEQRAFAHNGEGYLALFGPEQFLPRFPSGPPVYVFDSKGQLVDWTPDVGDDEAFKDRWLALYRGHKLTPDDVKRWPGASGTPAVP